jgi:hypothetical protein
MAVGSIVLAALSFVSIGLGVLATPVPVIGAIFAFGAPTLALAGVITGGIAMSRARRAGESRDLALAGVVACALLFVPALITALTCGVCNALCSTGRIETRRDFRFGVQPVSPPPPAAGAGQAGGAAPRAPASAPPPAQRGPAGDPGDPNQGSDAPPPAFPAPPIQQPPP